MNAADFTTCAYCPRLCRHVCPVAVGTGFESATPSAMMSAALLAAEGARPLAYAEEAAAACLGCGACTAHCKHHRPVSDLLAALRPAPTEPPPAPGATVPGVPEGVVAFVTCGGPAAPGPDQLACCGRREGFAARAPEAARLVAEENVRRLAGRPFACADDACADWLVAHGATRWTPPTDPSRSS